MALELYIHIPFCRKKCRYCDFLSFPEASCKEAIPAYIKALCKELQYHSRRRKDLEIATIYIGGGTPSVLDADQIKMIMDTVHGYYRVKPDAEITVECNPQTTTYEKFLAYRDMGINRLSIGLQSTNNEMLRRLGRIHTYETFLQQYCDARRAGYHNINVDLISALPGQTIKDYAQDVKKVIQLQPEHISSYSLIIEEGTPFSEDAGILRALPSEEEAVQMYDLTKKWLQDAGYIRYEISNYCKPGYESRHNSGYWTGVFYLGVGLGASSYLPENENYIRFHNETDMRKYIRQYTDEVDSGKVQKEKEILTRQDQMEEFMFLGLRMMKGICFQEFEKRFAVPITQVYGEVIQKYVKQKLLYTYEKEQKTFLAFTDQGISISNQVLTDFMF